MAKAWDIEPSIFAGMIEEDVGLKIRYIAIQILTAIDIAAPVDTGRFRNNNLVSLQHPDFGISDNVDPNGTIAVQRGSGLFRKLQITELFISRITFLMQRFLKTVIHNKRQLACMPMLFMVFYRLTNDVY